MKTLFVIAAYILILFGCEQEKISINRPFPRVNTMEVFDISRSGASFKAQILKLTDEEIIDYGFVWDTGRPTLETGDFYSYGPKIGEVEFFEFRIGNGLVAGQTYHVLSFLKTNSYVVYGNEISFISK